MIRTMGQSWIYAVREYVEEKAVAAKKPAAKTGPASPDCA
jgi:hypothetical protein